MLLNLARRRLAATVAEVLVPPAQCEDGQRAAGERGVAGKLSDKRATDGAAWRSSVAGMKKSDYVPEVAAPEKIEDSLLV